MKTPSPTQISAGAALVTALVLVVFLLKEPAKEKPLPGSRGAFLEAAEAYMGRLYQWGGGHAPGTWGLDCSGLVIQAAKDIGVTFPFITTADGFYRNLPAVETPEPGDLALYGSGGKAQHVVIVESVNPLVTIGANRGDNHTTTPEIAEQRNARVSRYEGHVRKDFLGYRRAIS